jgi:ABC-2 type transport system ATP-binding protein
MLLSLTPTPARPIISTEPAAQWQNIRYSYGAQDAALDQFSLTIGKGETLALLGPNGAGKSTAVKLLLGLLPAQQGTVRIHGGDPLSATTRASLGAVLQLSGLPSQLRVLEQLKLQASYYANALDPLALLQRLNLLELKDRKLSALSGGQRRRLEFAMALIGRPKLLVLDEPTAGVDIHERANLIRFLMDLKNEGVSILLTTHLIEEAEKLADRVAFLELGKLQFVGSIEQLQKRAGLSVLQFKSALPLDQLRTLLTHAEQSLKAIDSDNYELHTPDSNAFLRGLFAADSSAQISALNPTRLEDALRGLSMHGLSMHGVSSTPNQSTTGAQS